MEGEWLENYKWRCSQRQNRLPKARKFVPGTEREVGGYTKLAFLKKQFSFGFV